MGWDPDRGAPPTAATWAAAPGWDDAWESAQVTHPDDRATPTPTPTPVTDESVITDVEIRQPDSGHADRLDATRSRGRCVVGRSTCPHAGAGLLRPDRRQRTLRSRPRQGTRQRPGPQGQRRRPDAARRSHLGRDRPRARLPHPPPGPGRHRKGAGQATRLHRRPGEDAEGGRSPARTPPAQRVAEGDRPGLSRPPDRGLARPAR